MRMRRVWLSCSSFCEGPTQYRDRELEGEAAASGQLGGCMGQTLSADAALGCRDNIQSNRHQLAHNSHQLAHNRHQLAHCRPLAHGEGAKRFAPGLGVLRAPERRGGRVGKGAQATGPLLQLKDFGAKRKIFPKDIPQHTYTQNDISATWGRVESYMLGLPPPTGPGSPGSLRVVDTVPVIRALKGRGGRLRKGLQRHPPAHLLSSNRHRHGLAPALLTHPAKERLRLPSN